MGTAFLNYYRDRIKKTWKLAFYSAFCLGLLVHIFKFTNVLPNWDAMYNFYNSQNMVASGRWFLGIACSLSSFFDLPWLIGILSLVFMGIASAMVCEVFRMENPCLIVLSSGLLVSFPAITATMAYEFTVDGYMLAMVLASLSVCLTRMEYMDRTHWKKMVLSGVCICLTCAIYQAYLSFAFVLALCYFMTELLENRVEASRFRKWIVAQVVIYVCALTAYYLIWKLCLRVQGIEASSYQGLNQVGILGVAELVGILVKIFKGFVLFFLEWNIFRNGLTAHSFLSILFLLVFAWGVLTALIKSGCGKRKGHLALFLLCAAALPVGCFICYLTSPRVAYHTLMLQSICLLYIFTAVLFDRWAKASQGNFVLVLLAAIVFHNAVTANICYTLMDQAVKRTQAAAAEVSARIHMLDDGNIRYVAILGYSNEWDLDAEYTPGELRELGPWKTIDRSLLSPTFLSLYTDFDLSYYRSRGLEYPVVELGLELPAPENWEFRFPMRSLEEEALLHQSAEVREMPVWPARDSVKVIGDTIVVKLSEY